MNNILALAGAVGLLISGLFIMRYGLSKMLSQTLRQALARLTPNSVCGLLSGMLAAALLQGSTSVTLATVGLVSAGYLTLEQGLALILGANIGTCSTVGLMTVELPPHLLAGALAVSLALVLFAKGSRPAFLALTGLLSMLLGVTLLAEGLAGVARLQTVVSWLAAGTNPLYGIGAGVLMTFLFQSSSAATGLLMALASEGIVDLTTAAYGVYGNNIGSCLSSLLVSISAPLAAKRAALGHILLNLLGVLFFLPFTDCLTRTAALLSDSFGPQVAILHALFNIASSLAVLPVLRIYARLLVLLVPDTDPRA